VIGWRWWILYPFIDLISIRIEKGQLPDVVVGLHGFGDFKNYA
jgi:hypothetical protein